MSWRVIRDSAADSFQAPWSGSRRRGRTGFRGRWSGLRGQRAPCRL